MPNRHPTRRDRKLERIASRGNKRQIERMAPGVFRSPGAAREMFDTSSEWLDSIRSAIASAETALRDAGGLPAKPRAMR